MAEWIKEQRKYILFFDRPSQTTEAEKEQVTYEWGLGEMSNNRAEAYSLLLGTKILSKKGIKDPIIIKDSTIIIATMETGKEFKSSAINKISQRIKINTKKIWEK